MKPRPLLFNAEPEALGGNGPVAANIIPLPAAAAVAEETPAAPEAPAAAAAAPEAKPPTLLERISASVQSKGTLLSDLNTAKAELAIKDAKLTSAEAELTQLRASNASLLKERGDISALLEKVTAEKQEVDIAAAAQIAGLGFEAAKLPAAEAAPEETKEQLVARLEKETDNDKRYALAAKINAMP